MCQSKAAGGRRCATHTRPAAWAAIQYVMDADSNAVARDRRTAGRAAVVAHARTAMGREEMEEVVEFLYNNRRAYVDGLWAAKWVLDCCYEADDIENRPSPER